MSQQIDTNPNTAFDINGHPVPNSKVTFFITGTSTPIVVYLDEDLDTIATQPIEADGAGRFPQLFCANLAIVKAVVVDSEDAALYTLDPVRLSAATVTVAESIEFDPIPNNPATDVQGALENLQETVDDLDALDISYTNTDFPAVTTVDAALDATILKTGKTITTADLDTLITNGVYIQQNATLVSLARHYPYAANVNKGYFAIDVQAYAHGGVLQTARDGYSTWTRSLGLDPAVAIGSSVWTAWVETVDTDINGPWSYAWHPYNKVTLSDSATGTFYDSATAGAVATVSTAVLVDGYEYMIRGSAVSPSATATLRYELYRETDDLYNPVAVISPSTTAAQFLDFELELPSARRSTTTHNANYWSAIMTGTNAVTITQTRTQAQNNFITSQKIELVRLSFSTGNIDGGVIKLYRRRVTF